MTKFLFLLLAITCLHLSAETRFATADPDLISSQIVDLISTSAPILLDIQAGDLTSDLEIKIRQLLLQKSADVLEYGSERDSRFYYFTDEDTLALPNLDYFAVNSAQLVRISLDLGGTTIERKGFLSYHSERYPLYTFQIKQISLPQNKLLRIDSLSFVDKSRQPEERVLTNSKWFEPVLASTALATLIYLLWTIE